VGTHTLAPNALQDKSLGSTTRNQVYTLHHKWARTHWHQMPFKTRALEAPPGTKCTPSSTPCSCAAGGCECSSGCAPSCIYPHRRADAQAWGGEQRPVRAPQIAAPCCLVWLGGPL